MLPNEGTFGFQSSLLLLAAVKLGLHLAVSLWSCAVVGLATSPVTFASFVALALVPLGIFVQALKSFCTLALVPLGNIACTRS